MNRNPLSPPLTRTHKVKTTPEILAYFARTCLHSTSGHVPEMHSIAAKRQSVPLAARPSEHRTGGLLEEEASMELFINEARWRWLQRRIPFAILSERVYLVY